MDYSRFEGAIAKRTAGAYSEAFQELQDILNSRIESEDRAIVLGAQSVCLRYLGLLPEAREKIDEARSLSASPHNEFLDAVLCLAEGRNDVGIAGLRSFLKKHKYLIDPASIPDRYDPIVYLNALDELGQRLSYLDRYPEAIVPFEEAVGLSSGSERARICFDLGFCYRELGQFGEAERRFRDSLDREHSDPQWADAQCNLGWLLVQRGAYEQALTTLEVCESLGENLPDAWKDLVRALLDQTRARLSGTSRIQ